MSEPEFDREAELRKLPAGPGVYIMRDARDAIIYIGKAKNLKRRVAQYFNSTHEKSRGPKIQKMISLVARFEYILTDSELEALVLENNLIKEHRPRYNTLLKDDKTYPYIKVTLGEEYPRVLFSRQMKKDRSKYYGPFAGERAVRDTIDLVRKVFGIRLCRRSLPKDIGKERPCLNYHIHACPAPCQGYISKEEYAENVRRAVEFLNGSHAEIEHRLRGEMEAAAEEMDFERAAEIRDLIKSIKEITQSQKITSSDFGDRDIVALAREEEDCVVQVFFVRDGKLVGREHFHMSCGAESDDAEVLRSFLGQYYSGTPFLPHEIMLQSDIRDSDEFSGWLSGLAGRKVQILVPQKGKKEKLVELARRNAYLVLSRDRERIKREEMRTSGAAAEIAELLGIASAYRMEAYDISNTSGFESVGSMVVYEKGKPARSNYRKFRLKTVEGPDDYASMEEVLTRRFTHGIKEKRLLADRDMDDFGETHIKPDSFIRFPDLILMDGGKGQVHIAEKVLGDLGISIPVAGMVKDDRHRTRGLYYKDKEIPIDTSSEAFKLITRIQDEAHRFAIEYHRSLRSKKQVHSVLDDIPGIGPARRKALMASFDSIEEIKEASKERLMQIESIDRRAAESIIKFFEEKGRPGEKKNG